MWSGNSQQVKAVLDTEVIKLQNLIDCRIHALYAVAYNLSDQYGSIATVS